MGEFDRYDTALFDAARHAADPTPEDEARIRRALAAKVGGAVLSVSSLSVSTSAAAAAPGAAKGALGGGAMAMKALQASLLWKVLPLSVAVAIGGAAVVMVETQDRSKPVPVRSASGTGNGHREHASRPAAEMEPPPNAVVGEIELPSAPTPLAAAPRAATTDGARPHAAVQRRVEGNASHPATEPPAAPHDEASSFASEVDLVSQMHQAWQSGDLTAVERAVTDHGRRFPRGVLSEEREAMKVMLACRRSSDRRRAQQLALKFAAEYPNSPHAGRIAALCTAQRE